MGPRLSVLRKWGRAQGPTGELKIKQPVSAPVVGVWVAAGERQAVVLAGVTSCLVLRPGASASTCCLHVRVSDQGLEPGWEVRKQEVTGTRDPSNLNLCFPYPQSPRLPGLPSVSCRSPSAGDHNLLWWRTWGQSRMLAGTLVPSERQGILLFLVCTILSPRQPQEEQCLHAQRVSRHMLGQEEVRPRARAQGAGPVEARTGPP